MAEDVPISLAPVPMSPANTILVLLCFIASREGKEHTRYVGVLSDVTEEL